jgi:glycosyltransferase involved in cell wall biosynthesis
LRILHVLATLDPQSGGPAQACLEMAQSVAERGHAVSIFTTDFAVDGQDRRPAGLENYPGLDIQLFPVQAPRGWKRSSRLRQALDAHTASFDVVHMHSLYLFHNWAAARAARNAQVPYIIRPHGLLDPYIRRRNRLRKRVMELAFQDAALRHATAIHYTADLEREISKPYDGGAPPAVIPLGVTMPNTAPDRSRLVQRYPQLTGKTVVLFLGRLHQKKGLDLLIPALAQARERRPGLHLLLAGPDEGALAPTRDLIAAHQLGPHVTITGMLQGAEKAAAFAGADFFVLPSYSENFAIAAVEAMSYGLPVIVSDQVNIHPDISAAGAGSVIGCTVSALRDALIALASDVDRPAMGRRARDLVERRYSWRAIGQQLEALYAQVRLGQARSTAS